MIAIFQMLGDDEKVQPVFPKDASAGIDIRAPFDFALMEGSEIFIDTGLVIVAPNLNNGDVLSLVHPRSSSSKTNIRLKNTTGLIDQSYCGPGDRIGLFIEKTPSNWVHEFTVRKENYREKYAEYEVSELKKMKVVNSVDEDGVEWTSLFSRPKTPVVSLFKKGDKIAQIIFVNHLAANVVQKSPDEFEQFCDEHGVEIKDRGGWGSTGR